MQLRRVTVRNFRGIGSLDWQPSSAFCCILGPGDAGKTSILDAIEATLSPRWMQFSEADFMNCDTSNEIEIEVTLGELSGDLKSDERFGLFVRGWTSEGTLRDEPTEDDEPVLTVRLGVDATLEPVWELACDRADKPRTLSNRDRYFFGLVRLSGHDARHLSWGQGSVLAKLTDDTDETAVRLAGAYQSARESASFEDIPQLTDSAKEAEKQAKSLGAYINGEYSPGLELGRSGFSSGSITLHDAGVPLRQAGLGTRRLASLAIQKSGIQDGAIILIDEVEHGLEPHRIIGAISQIKADQKRNSQKGKPLGQILMTTHSDVALGEAGAQNLRFANRNAADDSVSVIAPEVPSVLKPILRFAPKALLAKRILVIEGQTEVGMLSGIKEFWPQDHSGIPIEQRGAAFADGNGSQAPEIALALRNLNYLVSLFRDSDQPLDAGVLNKLNNANVPIIEYAEPLNTEQALFLSSDDNQVGDILKFVHNEHGKEAVAASIASRFDGITSTSAQDNFPVWKVDLSVDANDFRMALGEIAHKKKWFKENRIGREVSELAYNSAKSSPNGHFAVALKKVENWLYG